MFNSDSSVFMAMNISSFLNKGVQYSNKTLSGATALTVATSKESLKEDPFLQLALERHVDISFKLRLLIMWLRNIVFAICFK